MNIYCDTSAYLCLVFHEEGWREIERCVRASKLYSSSLLFLEAQRNMIRFARQNKVSPEECLAFFDRLDEDRDLIATKALDDEICLDKLYPSSNLPKSLDMVHLRTASWFAKQGILLTFLSLDQSQRLAATEMGLKVVA